jgi:membrane protease YdiL (CAAX protease family)
VLTPASPSPAELTPRERWLSFLEVLVLGGVYLLSGRNLWAAILAHGLSDTFAVLVIFMGWAT